MRADTPRKKRRAAQQAAAGAAGPTNRRAARQAAAGAVKPLYEKSRPSGGDAGGSAHKKRSRPSGGCRGGRAPQTRRAAPRRLASGARRAVRAREPPVGSAASYPPEGLPLSTFGDGGLNCRVRDGTGCAPSSMAADPTGGSCVSGRHPGGQHSAQGLSDPLLRQHAESSVEKSSAD